MSKSCIQIILHPGLKQTALLEAPEGYEFTGEYRTTKPFEYYYERGKAISEHSTIHIGDPSEHFILRPIQTPKERRIAKLRGVHFMAKNLTDEQFVEDVERIFAENPDEVSK